MKQECGECEQEFEAKQIEKGIYENLCPSCLDDYDGPGDEYYES